IPDKFVTHGARTKLLELVGLTPDLLAARIEEYVNKGSSRLIRQFF
ncbi:MAG: hypothetical protein GY863_20155, partial [bacterium]|nr:hypothetical protein [bacterium]